MALNWQTIGAKILAVGGAVLGFFLWFSNEKRKARKEGRQESEAETAEAQLSENIKVQKRDDKIEARNSVDINRSRAKFYQRMRKQQDKNRS